MGTTCFGRAKMNNRFIGLFVAEIRYGKISKLFIWQQDLEPYYKEIVSV